MNPPESIPPPLPPPTAERGGTRWQPFWTLLVLVSLLMLARVAMQSALPVPGCPLRELTGVPCPLCGSTRAFAALAGLDFLGALRLNPLVSIAAGGVIAWSAFMLLRRNQPVASVQRWSGAPWKWLLAAALLLNWLYLLFCLPR